MRSNDLKSAVAPACKHTVQFKVNDDRPLWQMAYLNIGLIYSSSDWLWRTGLSILQSWVLITAVSANCPNTLYIATEM